MNIDEQNASEKNLNIILEGLLIEVKDISEENFGKWYEKKRKIFNTGVKTPPTKEEFIKYLNYALTLKF
ncbi:MAG: hypothetical protein ACYCSB_05020 [bacterium]|jgi:hypothetical protein